MADYIEPVRKSTRELIRFASELVDQLNLEHGSFRWWHGHTDYQRLALIADYLIQSTTGVADGLSDAALCAADHREGLYADNAWFRSTGQAVHRANPHADHEQYLRAFQRGPHEERRARRVAASATHTLIHLVQALDRLAAVLVIISGISTDVIKAGWPALERLAAEEDRKRKIYTAPTAEGVAAQRALLATSRDWHQYGPPDWLPWLLQTRHASAHRASTTAWHLTMVDPDNRMTGLLRPLFRQPSRSEMHSLAVGPDSSDESHSLAGLLVLEDSADVLDGLLASTNDFVLHMLDAAEETWRRRRDNPSFVIQPGSQWKLDTGEALRFAGYGKPARLQGADKLTVGTQLGRRLQAAKTMDADRSTFWA